MKRRFNTGSSGSASKKFVACHPKYGRVINPVYSNLEECFKEWSFFCHPIGCPCEGNINKECPLPKLSAVDTLRKLDITVLTTFLHENIMIDINRPTNHVWKTCFGDFYRYNDISSLTKDELIYYMLNLDNYRLLKTDLPLF